MNTELSLPKSERPNQTPIKIAVVSETIKLAQYPEKKKISYVDMLFNRGNGHLSRQEYDDAMKCYDKALELMSENNEIWYKKGIAFGELKMYNVAIKCIETAISLIK